MNPANANDQAHQAKDAPKDGHKPGHKDRKTETKLEHAQGRVVDEHNDPSKAKPRAGAAFFEGDVPGLVSDNR